MDARLTRVIVLLAISAATAYASTAYGGGHYSRNFAVTGPSAEFAKEVCLAAEHYRKTLAVAWLGKELPAWNDRCPVTVKVSPHLGAGGVTSFRFQYGRPFDWRMSIQGSQERILDSVLPHEVMHTVFATHFGRPLPRWADEGACTTVEHESEKGKHYQHLYRYMTSQPNRCIPFNDMFRMTEYPHDIMPLYAQGHSVVEFLVAQRGRRHFVDFLADGMHHQDWNRSIQTWYGLSDLSDLQIRWVDWLRNGRPNLQPTLQLAMASDAARGTVPENNDKPESRPSLVPQLNSSPSASALLASTAAKPAPTNEVIATGNWYSRQRDLAQYSLTPSKEPHGPFTPGSTVPVRVHEILRASSSPSQQEVICTSVVDWEAEGQWTSKKYRR